MYQICKIGENINIKINPIKVNQKQCIEKYKQMYSQIT